MYIFVRLPFNWKTPLGYFFCFILASLSCYASLYSILPSLCLVIGSYWIMCARLKVITNEFKIVTRKISIGCDGDLRKEFYGVIDDISDAKQLSDLILKSLFQYNIFQITFRAIGQYSDIGQFIITSTFLWVLFTITTTMLTIQSELVECNIIISFLI